MSVLGLYKKARRTVIQDQMDIYQLETERHGDKQLRFNLFTEIIYWRWRKKLIYY